jgi:hypothetical protein
MSNWEVGLGIISHYYKSWFFLQTKLVKKYQIVTFVNLTHHHSKQVDFKMFKLITSQIGTFSFD